MAATYKERLAEVSTALADPTRREIMDFVSSSSAPLSVQEVAQAFGLHANAARLHLEKLAKGGLLKVIRRRGKRGGRPAYLYLPSEEDLELHLPARHYRLLAEILVEGLSDMGEKVWERFREVSYWRGRREGLSSSSPLAHLPSRPGVEEVAGAWEEDLRMRGMRFRMRVLEGETIEVTFLACPFGGISKSNLRRPCSVHHGLEAGVLSLAGRWVVEREDRKCVFVAKREEPPSD